MFHDSGQSLQFKNLGTLYFERFCKNVRPFFGGIFIIISSINYTLVTLKQNAEVQNYNEIKGTLNT